MGRPVDLTLPAAGRLASDEGPNHLRADDLLFIAVAAIPGAVAGGRLGYYLLHLDYYQAHPGAIFDISQGGFELSLAVVGGTLSAAIVAALLGAPVGRWMHALIVPLLLALAAGKAAMVLGGDGQGVPWDGNLATAYLGPGPWGSLAPAVPSHAAQAYEARVHGHRPAGGRDPAHARAVRAPRGRRVPRRRRAVGRRTGHRRLDLARSGGRRPAEHGTGARDRRRGRQPGPAARQRPRAAPSAGAARRGAPRPTRTRPKAGPTRSPGPSSDRGTVAA